MGLSQNLKWYCRKIFILLIMKAKITSSKIIQFMWIKELFKVLFKKKSHKDIIPDIEIDLAFKQTLDRALSS